ncbi:hypothetical protein [Paenirhodobacter sp. CAU 1674]|uniref:hypothetical protein n=1 Tax=Paenirhodobacter sp. CAU 1674 TaxID=3032596 RepID=UPI0023DADBC9|nr:hypothetical protein [Paenirhodobacter sp. CAU 1674]MDF2143274.1 hypothetical protein [Paenirhodobacter sp. CAU 1674]
MRRLLLHLLLAVTPSLGAAQSLSVADLQKQIDAEVNKGNEYTTLLNDPDPKRAQAAMKVMLGSGDPDLISIALDYGLYSPDLAVRGAALKGLLDSKPRLDVFLTMTDPKNGFPKAVDYMFKVVTNAEGIATAPVRVTGKDEQLDCYTGELVKYADNTCLIQVRPEVIRVRLGYNWSEVRLNDDGALIGEVMLSNGQMAPVRIQLH